MTWNDLGTKRVNLLFLADRDIHANSPDQEYRDLAQDPTFRFHREMLEALRKVQLPTPQEFAGSGVLCSLDIHSKLLLCVALEGKFKILREEGLVIDLAHRDGVCRRHDALRRRVTDHRPHNFVDRVVGIEVKKSRAIFRKDGSVVFVFTNVPAHHPRSEEYLLFGGPEYRFDGTTGHAGLRRDCPVWFFRRKWLKQLWKARDDEYSMKNKSYVHNVTITLGHNSLGHYNFGKGFSIPLGQLPQLFMYQSLGYRISRSIRRHMWDPGPVQAQLI